MSHRFCHRCQAELPTHDEGTLIFCPHCGAAQVELSEELKEQMERPAETPTEAEASPAKLMPRDASSLVWRDALRCVGLAAAVAAALNLGSLIFPRMILFTWLWSAISPIVVIGIFQARSPLTPMTTGFGARLGLVTGLAIGSVLSVMNAATVAIQRYTHHAGDLDAQIHLGIDNLRMQIEAQAGANANPMADIMRQPEFAATMMLLGFALAFALLLVVTTTGGAFAGFIRRRGRA